MWGATVCILWLIQGKFSGLVPLVLCSDILQGFLKLMQGWRLVVLVSCYSSKGFQPCILTLRIRIIENYTKLKWQKFALLLGHLVSLTSNHVIFFWGTERMLFTFPHFCQLCGNLLGGYGLL